MKLYGKFYSITTGGVYKALNVDFKERKIKGTNKQAGEQEFDFKDVIWLESTGIKINKNCIYTDDYVLAVKDHNVIACGVVKKRADGSYAIVNKNQGTIVPLLQLQIDDVKLINLQNHKIYFAKKSKIVKK
ncbi:hypothetical protein [Fusobacterium pseudoperiodonticum]|uniref:hypothetical protein n=1 Tax=Fusobacterium pseudoperiodonticum TaxID=2663009 RepID=UPI000C1BA124|nr:hypothetical protein [Fusobacterium pseudoperiodonticum]ATV63198.1 hypothetical protein CTM78_01560 [Fusobacterium pseudoperiodonticum]